MSDEQENDLGKIFILEDDTSLAGMIMNDFRIQGFTKLTHAPDGEKAWEILEKEKFDFILMDWKVPNLSSLAIFNRLKQHRHYKKVPILVMSGFLNTKDFSILSEYHNTSNIEKPFVIKFLLSKMHILKKEANWYLKQEAKVKKLLKELDVKDYLFEKSVYTLLSGSPNPLPISICLGKALREKKEYEYAKKILHSALRYGENAVILSELGKIYLLEGNLTKAKQFLEQAHQKSPDNLERLCSLGNVYLENLELYKAEETFSKALEIDGESHLAQSGKVLTNNIEKWLAGAVSVPETYAGILNSVGIAMVRSGQFTEGIEHYTSALLHVQQHEIKAKLGFNLGLAYMRWKKPKSALKWFKRSKFFNPSYIKVNHYIEKIEKYLNDLQSQNLPQSSKEKSFDELDEDIEFEISDFDENLGEGHNDVDIQHFDDSVLKLDKDIINGEGNDDKDDETDLLE